MTKFLGKVSHYPAIISSKTLDFIPRNRIVKGNVLGVDVWNCYEFYTVINHKYAHLSLTFSVSCHSTHIVESKSLKLYLNSYYNTNFQTIDHIIQRLYSDFEGAGVDFETLSIDAFPNNAVTRYPLHQVMESSEDQYGFSQARIINHQAAIWPYFRSVCPVTNQPDWAWVIILLAEAGEQVVLKNVQDVLLNYREKPSFHEQCADEIWTEISQYPSVSGLTMLFNRRGGIEINPSRGWIPTQNLKSNAQ